MKVNGIKCRALIDSGAGSSYASAKLTHLLNIRPSETRTAKVDMLLDSKVSRLENYNAKLEDVDSDYSLEVKLTKVHKNELQFVDNPGYDQLICKYPHLKDVRMNDAEINAQLPVHLVLESGEYARMKTDQRPLVRAEGQPVAELTKLGWFIMSPGTELDKTTMLMTQTSYNDYDELCINITDAPWMTQQLKSL